ncbi:MAG TPA: cation-translocating P-type ATPase [Casimicrobiaceae bacterium]|nr:cation-translocating P-type ATPase [Casimicrobiaceae bacterium]
MLATPYRVDDAHARDAADVLAALAAEPSTGLTSADAAGRLAAVGPNALPHARPPPWWRRLVAEFTSPLVVLLLAAAAVSIGVWTAEDHAGPPFEALTILAIVLLNGLLGFFQEARAERAVAGLQAMSAATAVVVRDGERRPVAAAEVVPGDIVVVEEGMTVPADARVIDATALAAAEAALTGESTPVSKRTPAVAKDAPLAERTAMLYAGTVVTTGHGLAVVVATGGRTEFGRIAGLLAATTPVPTPLQRELDRLGKVLGAIVIAIAVVVAATILAMQASITAAVLVGVLLYTVSLAVSAVPEGLAAVTTVVLSLGMQRMATRNAIVRRLSAVETLGSATVIASDKTGTLTRNEMTVRAILTASGPAEITGTGYAPVGTLQAGGAPLGPGAQHTEVRRLLAAASLASNAALSETEGGWTVQGDPTEGALLVAARKAGLTPELLRGRFSRIGEIPFSSERKLMSTSHADAHADGGRVLFAKGAPDVLLARCTLHRVGSHERPLDDARRAAVVAEIDDLAGRALRTLGVAYRRLPGCGAHEPGHEEALVWLGLVGMIDPPRPEARDAVAAAHRAGVRVLMITGDHPAAAGAIAAELGIAARGEPVLTGPALKALEGDALRAAVARTRVFARVEPEQKLAIVRALQADGQVVAMTGDGVNDAPALKAADIGIAMGLSGTDVSREAADMVLADDNFATIVAAIEEGRAIYANIQKFLRYLLATNLGEVVVMFFGVLLAGTIGLASVQGEALVLPLTAAMILWINLVTDGLPALALGVDPPVGALMTRPPRAPRSGVITPRMWIGIGAAALTMGAGTLLLLDASMPGGLLPGDGDVRHGRTLAFHALVLYQLVDAVCVRSDEVSAFVHPFNNPWLWGSIAAALALQAAVLYVPLLQQGFGTVPLTAAEWGLCIAVAATVLVVREAVKVAFRMRDRARG